VSWGCLTFTYTYTESTAVKKINSATECWSRRVLTYILTSTNYHPVHQKTKQNAHFHICTAPSLTNFLHTSHREKALAWRRRTVYADTRMCWCRRRRICTYTYIHAHHLKRHGGNSAHLSHLKKKKKKKKKQPPQTKTKKKKQQKKKKKINNKKKKNYKYIFK